MGSAIDRDQDDVRNNRFKHRARPHAYARMYTSCSPFAKRSDFAEILNPCPSDIPLARPPARRSKKIRTFNGVSHKVKPRVARVPRRNFPPTHWKALSLRRPPHHMTRLRIINHFFEAAPLIRSPLSPSLRASHRPGFSFAVGRSVGRGRSW